jgi:hypothetical protein
MKVILRTAMFDNINAFIMHDPALLALVQFLFWVKYWILLGIAGIFVFLVYAEDVKKKRAEKVPVPLDQQNTRRKSQDDYFLA